MAAGSVNSVQSRSRTQTEAQCTSRIASFFQPRSQTGQKQPQQPEQASQQLPVARIAGRTAPKREQQKQQQQQQQRQQQPKPSVGKRIADRSPQQSENRSRQDSQILPEKTFGSFFTERRNRDNLNDTTRSVGRPVGPRQVNTAVKAHPPLKRSQSQENDLASSEPSTPRRKPARAPDIAEQPIRRSRSPQSVEKGAEQSRRRAASAGSGAGSGQPGARSVRCWTVKHGSVQTQGSTSSHSPDAFHAEDSIQVQEQLEQMLSKACDQEQQLRARLSTLEAELALVGGGLNGEDHEQQKELLKSKGHLAAQSLLELEEQRQTILRGEDEWLRAQQRKRDELARDLTVKEQIDERIAFLENKLWEQQLPLDQEREVLSEIKRLNHERSEVADAKDGPLTKRSDKDLLRDRLGEIVMQIEAKREAQRAADEQYSALIKERDAAMTTSPAARERLKVQQSLRICQQQQLKLKESLRNAERDRAAQEERENAARSREARAEERRKKLQDYMKEKERRRLERQEEAQRRRQEREEAEGRKLATARKACLDEAAENEVTQNAAENDAKKDVTESDAEEKADVTEEPTEAVEPKQDTEPEKPRALDKELLELPEEPPHKDEVQMLEHALSYVKSLLPPEVDNGPDQKEVEYNNPEGSLIILPKEARSEEYLFTPMKPRRFEGKVHKRPQTSKLKKLAGQQVITHSPFSLQLFEEAKLMIPFYTTDVPASVEKVEARLSVLKADVMEWEKKNKKLQEILQVEAADKARCEKVAAKHEQERRKAAALRHVAELLEGAEQDEKISLEDLKAAVLAASSAGAGPDDLALARDVVKRLTREAAEADLRERVASLLEAQAEADEAVQNQQKEDERSQGEGETRQEADSQGDEELGDQTRAKSDEELQQEAAKADLRNKLAKQVKAARQAVKASLRWAENVSANPVCLEAARKALGEATAPEPVAASEGGEEPAESDETQPQEQKEEEEIDMPVILNLDCEDGEELEFDLGMG
eukprot:TRINITY_DN16817_c1_g1_i2.p1 TRINITY_DN16817_c1_g1~~TRINITY_DN16817_c1_g1_i2.p1  ORF type:complete len:998 (-),score=307.69 TRINITY_DN16817_c1_g1_i2:60-3053(-)